MANETKEKILNTRIINKHASLADWRNTEAGTGKGADFKLKEGEIALARIELTDNKPTSGEDNNISSTPAYIIKVGTEGNNFDDSAWAYAKAVDVYAWAKQANLPVVCADDTTAEGYVAGNVISSISFEDDKIKYTTATVATSEGFEALTGKVAAIEGYLEISQDEEGNTVVGLVDRVSALETLVGDTSVSEQISSAIDTLIGDGIDFTNIATLKYDLQQAIQGDTTTTVGTLEYELDTLAGETIPSLLHELQGDTTSTIADVEVELSTLANETIPGLLSDLKGDTTSTVADVEGQVSDLAGDGRTTETVKGNAEAIAEINTWISGDEPGAGAESRISTLETVVNGTEANPGGLIHAVSNATEHIADKDNPHEVTKAQVGLGNVENKSTATIKEEFTGAIADGNTGFVTGDAVYDVKVTADAAKARIDAFIDGTAEAESAIDTLVEIQQYITSDVEAFTALSTKVTNIENGTTHTVAKSLDADAQAQVKGIKVDKAVDADTIGGINTETLLAMAESTSSMAVKNLADDIDQRKYANEDYVKTSIESAIQELDVTDITGMGAGKTIATLTETDGKIAATFQDIAITKSQITDFSDDDYAKPGDIGNGTFTVTGTGCLTGSGSMTANQSSNTTANIDLNADTKTKIEGAVQVSDLASYITGECTPIVTNLIDDTTINRYSLNEKRLQDHLDEIKFMPGVDELYQLVVTDISNGKILVTANTKSTYSESYKEYPEDYPAPEYSIYFEEDSILCHIDQTHNGEVVQSSGYAFIDDWGNLESYLDDIVGPDSSDTDREEYIKNNIRYSIYRVSNAASLGIERGAQVNTIETIKVNGTALDIEDKTVNITIPELPESIDTAVQTITSNCTAGQETSGLKVTRTENSVNIEIDAAVTFIFDCGGAE